MAGIYQMAAEYREQTALCFGAGVGMEYPSVIRFPFEKVVFYNQKAFMYRIHSKLYQVSEEMGGRGAGIQAAAVDYICEKQQNVIK